MLISEKNDRLIISHAAEIESDSGLTEEEPTDRFFLKMILSILLIAVLIFFVVPLTAIPRQIQPQEIPTLDELREDGFLGFEAYSVSGSPTEKLLYYKSTTFPEIKTIASYVASRSCPEPDTLCYAKALYYFTRDNIQYISDPHKTEYIESPHETLKAGSADCDGFAVLLASMYNNIGLRSRYVIIKNHIFIQVRIPDAPRRYIGNDGYIPLDPTCSWCRFGELSPSNLGDWAYLG
ncbi:MAG TPA: hypothetical protein ENN46_04790 [Candidatus Woesearchaeota archaeon]|nr:hypothetical protein [Candidatus Woesearchaeota archaeon]